MTPTKDRRASTQEATAKPLLLRRRRDGTMWLLSDEPPAVHTFSRRFVMDALVADEARIADGVLEQPLANGLLRWEIVRMENDEIECRLDSWTPNSDAAYEVVEIPAAAQEDQTDG